MWCRRLPWDAPAPPHAGTAGQLLGGVRVELSRTSLGWAPCLTAGFGPVERKNGRPSSPRSNQPSAHVVARFHPLAQPPEAIRASRTRKSSRWRLALQTDCDSFSGPSSLKRLPNMLRISRARCRQTQRRYPARRGKLDHDHQLGGLSFDRRACDFALRLMGASLPISLNRPVTLR